MDHTFNQKIERYFSVKLSWGPVQVVEAKRLAGGISRETWRVSMLVGEPDVSASREIILRLDPSASLLESNRDIEYALIRALADAQGVPVPEALCNESDPSHLGSSFMATAALPGVADIPTVLKPPYAEVGPAIVLAHFEVLGAISRIDPVHKQLDKFLRTPSLENTAAETLAYWETELQERSLGSAPITQAAIRHLKRNLPPPPARLSMIHGDYRVGNCLYLSDGSISGVLDWEMAHLGDPLEDLAWAMHPDWRPTGAPPHLVGGHISEEEAVHAWESSCGQRVTLETLNWWRLFSCVKAAAIFTAGGHNFEDKAGTELVYALGAWGMIDNEEAQMIHWMGKDA